jgi:tRNA modification GTPase
MDTAGVRATTDVVETLGIERTQAAIADAEGVVMVFDRSTELGNEDRMVAQLVGHVPTIGALAKADLPARLGRDDVASLLGSVPIVEVSARTGVGLAELGEALASLLLAPTAAVGDEEVAIFRVRHRDAARQAIEDLDRADRALRDRAPIDLVADDLAAAASALAGITGEVSSEDVLDRVFAEFCIGK